MHDTICIIIPAYNASETIAEVVRGAREHIPRVVVADDGSTDDTPARAAQAGAEVLSMGRNRGKGHALQCLFAYAREKGYSAAISLDADGQHDTGEIPRFVQAHLEHPRDIILGSRMHEKEKIPRARYNSMQIARFYVSLAADQFVEDTQCGYRLYPLEAISGIHLTTPRYVTETEILMKAGGRGTRIRPLHINTIYGAYCSHFRPVLDVAAITVYVISFLVVKWFLECIIPGRRSYPLLHRAMDFFCGTRALSAVFQITMLATFLPVTAAYLLFHLCTAPFIKYNFESLRDGGTVSVKFFRVILATQLLPVLLCLTILEKPCGKLGLRVRLVDRFIAACYPCLW